jgi:cytochrome c
MKRTALALVLAAAALGGAGALAQDRPPGGMMGQQGGNMGGMMGQGRMPSLKEMPAEKLVKSVRYCERKYFVTTVAGDVLEFREFDLRFKTDADEQGPRRGTPALLPAGGMGDRAFLIFSDPAEISAYIEKKCTGG